MSWGPFGPGTFCHGDTLSGQNVPACLYSQAGTFCPDKTSPLAYIAKRRRFVWTKRPWTKVPGQNVPGQNVPRQNIPFTDCPHDKLSPFGYMASRDILSGQNVPAWLYGQAGTFCPNKMSHDKTSPFGNIGKRRHFVRGHFVLGIFCLGDILSWGHFVLGTFCLVDILSCGHFVLGTFCLGDVLSLGTFCPGTFCLGDILSWGQFVMGTICKGDILSGDIMSSGTFFTWGHFVLSLSCIYHDQIHFVGWRSKMESKIEITSPLASDRNYITTS